MSAMQPLLIEVGTDELPVAALPGLAQALFDGVIDGLSRRGVAVERGDAKPLHSPRRLAVLLPGIGVEQPEQRGEVLGPYLNIALDADGNPTRALQGFAAKAGVEWTALERTTDAKGERFVHRSVTPGQATAMLLPEILREAVAAMPIPKPMRWGAHAHAFARPVHWLVVLLGDQVVEADLFGLRSDRMSRGHRFLHEGPVWIGAPGDYVDALRNAHVLADPDERRERIVREVEAAAAKASGTARITPDNLAQVACLVEWPEAVACSFDREFLEVPAEALVATMEVNQKFFPVLDADGALTEHFVGVANIPSTDVAEVRKGYERVIRPRFADAKFFFDEDLKQGLAPMGAGLANVTYQAKLGSVADKVARVAALADTIARAVDVDPALARRAAELSKNDLQSRMVNEFPELQGIAGRHYATAAGEPAEVAAAIWHHCVSDVDGHPILASSANLLLKHGWRAGQPWLEEVRVPEELPWAEADLAIKHPRAQWAAWGVTMADGSPLQADQIDHLDLQEWVQSELMPKLHNKTVNEIIGLVKGTSIVSVMAIAELFYQVQVIYGRNGRVVAERAVLTLVRRAPARPGVRALRHRHPGHQQGAGRAL